MEITSNYKIFKIIAILLGIIVFVWLIYDFIISQKKINKNYIEANNSFLREDYTKALNLYQQVLQLEPDNLYAIEGQARSLMRLKRYEESEKIFTEVLQKDENFVPALTNIAILYDTIGDYTKAVIFYKKALSQDNRVTKRMSWFKRFIKNIQIRPSTIEERLLYLEQQLTLERKNRTLRNKEIDRKQPDYQM